jgi:hypothetical protein
MNFQTSNPLKTNSTLSSEFPSVTMKTIICTIAILLLSGSTVKCSEPVAKQYLRYLYGAGGIDFKNICHLTDDAWMLGGSKDPDTLTALESKKIELKPTGIVSGVVGTNMYFVETRDGKVDPAFNLESIYSAHRRAVLTLIYAALKRDNEMIGALVTDATKVQIIGPKPAPGEMAQYASIIDLMPVVRSSKPSDDAKSKTVTYRVPMGDEALSLTLIRDAGIWKIDSSKTIRVPLDFFFRSTP